MKHLLYCVLETPRERTPVLTGVKGQPVFLVAGNGLSAAVSNFAGADLPATLPALLAYEKVVESLHRKQAVIPLRYGAVFKERASILALLVERNAAYSQLLADLDDRAEMGIRVLIEQTACSAVGGFVGRGRPAGSRSRSGDGSGLGAGGTPALHSGGLPHRAADPGVSAAGVAYLARLRDRYAEEARLGAAERAAIAEVNARLSGLFARSKAESRLLAGKVLLSLHFLVAKKAVGEFRRACREAILSTSAKLLVSGPWPPYNFVALGPESGAADQEAGLL